MNENYKIIKEEHFWSSDEKIKLIGYGEWVEEPDSVVIEYLGYKAIVCRVIKKEHCSEEEVYFGGHLCGYVNIPENHPFFRKKDINIDVHCGLTFNEAHEVHLIGFDCAHSCDVIPSMEYLKKNKKELKEFENIDFVNPVYRNIEYCIKECLHIIDQLDKIKAPTKPTNLSFLEDLSVLSVLCLTCL